jgi:signal peptidase II
VPSTPFQSARDQVQYAYLPPRKEEKNIVLAKRARLYDALALLTAIVIITLDQWTKALVVRYLSPPETHPPIPLIGDYLTIYYIQNRGAAFGLFANTIALTVLIAVAICVISYLYFRMLNTGTLAYKLIFGMIIGGAVGNLTDRALHSGYVVDFIYFRIPEIHYHFAIFNIADASISVGVFLLFVSILFGGLRRSETPSKSSPTSQDSNPLRSTEQDAQS